MNIFLDDSNSRSSLYPFTLTRHTADIRIGILTIREKWEQLTGATVITNKADANGETIVINAAILPAINNFMFILEHASDQNVLDNHEEVKALRHPWNIFQWNDRALRQDFQLLTNGRKSRAIPATNSVIAPGNIFIEEGAVVEHSILNASAGPIYIGKNAQVMEGCLIRGPFSLGGNALLKMGTKIYGATTLGPNCVGGGEIKNAVLFANSNKAHDGYLGDSVLGEWCNLGAGTSNSNVKNTGGNVKYITGANQNAIIAGNKAGLLMGDYSRAAINTGFNTGTIVGVCCNVFGEAPAKFINNFSWGNERYIFEKAVSDIANWKKMKGQEIQESEIEMLRELYTNHQ
jgi:UDP-N-acetylglucosamine diphosphorylase / glucose-1-phosphate thymidylyltransferase / UDP-N-acetylgalactosamine diphosphorylase / glucosamine-1-phosphate N-acetyltransferase / galactosamine-1-phosphate N-acetyltransferase